MRFAVKVGATLAVCGAYAITPAVADDNAAVITQASAEAGGVIPGDTPGFPITISESGSYRLGSNLQVPAGQNGIAVTGSNVSLDLDGFAMTGGGAALTGIIMPFNGPFSETLSVRGGTIAHFTSLGIEAQYAEAVEVEDMRVYGNGDDGIKIGTGAGRLSRNDVSFNGGAGIVCYFCHAEGNLIVKNGNTGIMVGEGIAIGNTILYNKYSGIAGRRAASGKNMLSGNNAANPALGQKTQSVFDLDPNTCFESAASVPGPC